ncbi:GGDEF domain-containing protein [Jiella sonneratiae]|uniref:diguanylate cyclase n=1 Tax=Jiella sonneratiae TaxID=2816856 RepID=A0ABS3J7N5_9HYPH|nr:GGDEF domain-containing protein [Jiella sonneratiae]MBO0905655.1 GGDEF domain-containing protein [Jiella sonneratiae]
MIRRWWSAIRGLDRFTRILLFATCALAGIAIVTSIEIQSTQREIADISNYNLSYVYARNQVEILRLRAAIGDAMLEGGNPAAARLRWAIVKGRVSTIPAAYGPVAVPEAAAARRHLEETLDSIAPLLASLQDPGTGARALRRLDALADEFTRLTALTNVRQSSLTEREQALLAATMTWLSASILALCCIGLALLALVFRQKRHLKEMAATDVLTGLPNRVAINAWRPVNARSVAVALAVIDVDRFKEVNDTLGHASGDDLLRRLGSVLREEAGGDALAVRLGGDEFVVIFTGADAWKRVEGRTAAIEAGFRTACKDTEFAWATLSIGMALGQAATPADLEALITQADGAMYAAKRGGRQSRGAVAAREADAAKAPLAPEIDPSLNGGALVRRTG